MFDLTGWLRLEEISPSSWFVKYWAPRSEGRNSGIKRNKRTFSLA